MEYIIPATSFPFQFFVNLHSLTVICLILIEVSDSEKCSILVSCKSISVSHTSILSLVVSNSSLVTCMCRNRLKILLHRLASMSHLLLASWTIVRSCLLLSVRPSRARRRYCLLMISSWARFSWTFLWNIWKKTKGVVHDWCWNFVIYSWFNFLCKYSTSSASFPLGLKLIQV